MEAIDMRASNTIIIMHGGPTTGKTTIGRRLAQSLSIPYFSKDGVKEPIFDCVGCPTAWETDAPLSGRRMDDASCEILFYLMAEQLRAGCACIIDSTFTARHTPTLHDLNSRHPFLPIQVLCRAEADVLEQRYRRRAETGERHPGHLDQGLSENFDAAAMEKIFRPLDIGGHILTADTTDFTDDDYRRLLQSIESFLESGPASLAT